MESNANAGPVRELNFARMASNARPALPPPRELVRRPGLPLLLLGGSLKVTGLPGLLWGLPGLDMDSCGNFNALLLAPLMKLRSSTSHGCTETSLPPVLSCVAVVFRLRK